jgi:hypothetical protein
LSKQLFTNTVSALGSIDPINPATFAPDSATQPVVVLVDICEAFQKSTKTEDQQFSPTADFSLFKSDLNFAPSIELLRRKQTIQVSLSSDPAQLLGSLTLVPLRRQHRQQYKRPTKTKKTPGWERLYL